MISLRRTSRELTARHVLKVAGITAAAAAAVPVLAAAGLAGADWFMYNDREKRQAPDPGTFHTTLDESELTIYTSGEQLYEDMLDAIHGAEHSILMETYIWKADEIGQRFIDALNQAAERGVQVYVLFDGFANLVVPRSFYRQFSDRVRVIRLPVIGLRFWKGPIRHTGLNHSKILAVDNEIGFVGGYNIGSHYAKYWRDTHLREIGPGVWDMQHSVAQLWNEMTKPPNQIPWEPPRTWQPEVEVNANLPVQLVYPIRQMYLHAIDRASEHIWVTTPYFIPDQQIVEGLIAAADRGVDVRVMVPKNSNHIVADWASRGFYGQLLDAGITLLLYKSSMIHAKTATIDGEWSTVGTANIDRLSLSYNYETNVEIIDPRFAAELEKVFLADAEHCEVIDSAQWRERHPMARVVEHALKPLRPLL
ncbi:phospholipase D-like domain-containing protein [Enteractinococcus fodinae]|uniref:Cardiolipin synthase n=1 Tax=Enteractinococcus fodinae TaxID=684663 RepID=A0ABU2B1Y9_9MICC|nr:phospholipase D-like domain-containing protein [Enteractinococcus fodinae]MDR7347617.1 cardiolipin synthase [Enteractinococcus fodinae]